jgi:transcriptional regulator with XRE-family HTH domain
MNVDKLRKLRLRELEEESGVSYNTIWRLENGHRQARPSTIRKLATALGVDPAELVIAGEGGDV